jgi:hypothetical protein
MSCEVAEPSTSVTGPPRSDPSTANRTLPVALAGSTVAVNRTASPNFESGDDDVTVVADGSASTICVNVWVLAVKLPLGL